MKRYISAVLIPCLLIQLFGCYSTRLISTYDLVDEEISYNDIELIQVQSANVLGTIGFIIVGFLAFELLAFAIWGFDFNFSQ